MSTHPNAMLILILTPDDLARKTHRELMTAEGIESTDDDFKIGGVDYHHRVMEDDYDDSSQISAPEGSIVLHDFLTYGYGERVTWEKASKQKEDLEEWAKRICVTHHCRYEISIGANYW